MSFANQLKFERTDDRHYPGGRNGRLLMMAWMNGNHWKKTIATGKTILEPVAQIVLDEGKAAAIRRRSKEWRSIVM